MLIARHELQCPPGRVDRVVAVPAQFDVHAALRSRSRASAAKDRRKVHLALAEHQVVVNAAAHVLDVHVPQPSLPAPHVFRDRQLALAVQMADVQRQPEARMIDAPCSSANFAIVSMNMPGSGSNASRTLLRGRVVAKLRQPSTSRFQQIGLGAASSGVPDQKLTASALSIGGHVDGAAQEIEARLAIFVRVAEQRRLMLAARIEQETSARSR